MIDEVNDLVRAKFPVWDVLIGPGFPLGSSPVSPLFFMEDKTFLSTENLNLRKC